MNGGPTMTVAALSETGMTDQARRPEAADQDPVPAPDARYPSDQDRPDCQDRLPSAVYGELMRAAGSSGWSCWHALDAPAS